jgi:CBS domain-containing protein
MDSEPRSAPSREEHSAGPDALTKGTLIGDAHRVTEEPCVVGANSSLQEIAERLSEHRGARIVCVVDEQGVIAGIIPLHVVLDDLFLKVAPEEFLADLMDADSIAEYGRLLRARTAADLMQEPRFVTPDQTLGEAFSLMHETKLEELPIVDNELRPIGQLDRLELIRVWFQQHSR